jgi:hypothetical protein
VDPRAGLWKFLTLPRLELRPFGRPARSQSLYRQRYCARWSHGTSMRYTDCEDMNWTEMDADEAPQECSERWFCVKNNALTEYFEMFHFSWKKSSAPTVLPSYNATSPSTCNYSIVCDEVSCYNVPTNFEEGFYYFQEKWLCVTQELLPFSQPQYARQTVGGMHCFKLEDNI